MSFSVMTTLWQDKGQFVGKNDCHTNLAKYVALKCIHRHKGLDAVFSSILWWPKILSPNFQSNLTDNQQRFTCAITLYNLNSKPHIIAALIDNTLSGGDLSKLLG